MIPSKNALGLIRLSEGLRLRPYSDAVGYGTIGYGHKILPNEDFSGGITLEIAEKILQEDADIAGEAVNRFVKVPLEQYEFDALVDFTFNMGAGALAGSTLLRVLNAGDKASVPSQLYRVDENGKPHGWILAGDKVLPGLVTRRKREIALWQGAPYIGVK